MDKRNLFSEIAEGFDALASERTGKQTLRTPLFLPSSGGIGVLENQNNSPTSSSLV